MTSTKSLSLRLCTNYNHSTTCYGFLPFSSCDLGRRRGSVTVVVSAVSTGAEDGLRFVCNPGLRTKDGVEGGSVSFVASSSLNCTQM